MATERAKITTRLARPRDASSVTALLAAQLREHEVPARIVAIRRTVRRILSDARVGVIMVALCGEAMVGVAYVATLPSVEHAGSAGWLEELFVAPKFRSRGIGTRLLEKILSHGRRRGWRGIELEIFAGHQRVASLYARHGFRPRARRRYARMFPTLSA